MATTHCCLSGGRPVVEVEGITSSVALVTLQRQNPHFLRQSPATHLLHKMLPLMLTALLAASAVVDARTFRAGGVVTGSGRAPPPQQEHSGEFFWVTFVRDLV